MPDLSSIRNEYLRSRLDQGMLDPSPFTQFRCWLNDALHAQVEEPAAMTLATAGADGRPSARMVLLKDLDKEGFTFFTHYGSRKGEQLEVNPFAALVFFWPALERQIRVEGKVTRIASQVSDAYFNTRPEGSRIGAWASPQSRRIPGRGYLENLQREYRKRFRQSKPSRPPGWGGYKLVPVLFEFWQGRKDRLHDRFEYSLEENRWTINRLAP